MPTLSMRIVGFVVVVSTLLFPVGALAAPETSGETIHVVQWGETLSLIASRYGVTVEAIMTANGLDDPNFVYVGQRLIIPMTSPVSRGCTNYYTVRWGDTLSGIAWRYGATANALMHANNLYSDVIYEGQRLCVPPGGAPSSPYVLPSHYTYYTVRPGDTLAVIAWQFGVSQAAIVQANNLANPSFIYVGQRLLIPGVSTTVAGAPAATTAPAPPPEYQPPQAASVSEEVTLPRSSEPVVVRSEVRWVGSQTAHNADPDEITTLLVMTHEEKNVDVMISSADGFVARGVTGVFYEYSWIPSFAFRDIPGGDYEVWVEGQPSKIVKARVDPGWRALVELKNQPVSADLVVSPAGWVGEVVENTSGTEPIGAFSILVVRTGAIGNKVRVTAPGGFEAVCITGTKPEHGRGACDVGGLSAGTYQVILDGADIAVEVYLDGIGTATVEFRPV